MCCQRLNCWKTIASFERMRSTCFMSAGAGRAVAGRHADQLALDPHLAAVRRLEQVDAAQEGRLARARRAEDRDDVVLVRGERDALEHLVARRRSCGSTARRGRRGPRSGIRRSPSPAPRLPRLPRRSDRGAVSRCRPSQRTGIALRRQSKRIAPRASIQCCGAYGSRRGPARHGKSCSRPDGASAILRGWNRFRPSAAIA